MINWSTATPDQLGELYDALCERNELIDKALGTINYRINGERAKKIYAMQDEALSLSNDLGSTVLEEIKRRHESKANFMVSVSESGDQIDWSTATPDELAELYDALCERNTRLMRTLDQIHFRASIGNRSVTFRAAKREILSLSNYLATSVREEIKKREPKETK